MVSRSLVLLLIAWVATAAPAAAEPESAGTPSPPGPRPDQSGAAMARDDSGGRPSGEDDELIRNLELIEHLDLLDAAEALGAVNAPDTPEEEF